MNRKVAKNYMTFIQILIRAVWYITYFVCYFLRDLLMYVLNSVMPDLKWPEEHIQAFHGISLRAYTNLF
jgi:hypothetical protein